MSSHRGVVSGHGPQPTGSYPHAHVHGGVVWVTAQAGRDPGSGGLVPGGIEGQLSQAIDNPEAILEGCDSSLDRVIRAQNMYTGPDDAAMNHAGWARRLPAPPPLWTAGGVKVLPAG